MASAMSTAVEATSAMEAATTMKSSASVEPATASAKRTPVMEASAGNTSTPTASVDAATAPSTAVPASPVVRAAPVSVVPRTSADEYPTHKPIRAVEAVGRARVRIVVIVAVRANGRRAVIARSNSDANGDLRLGIRSGEHHYRQQS